MDRAEAERIAKEYAQQQGYNPDEYTVGNVQVRDGGFWIFFQGRSQRPGDHFSVDVDANAGRATALTPGR
jgi:hypothetical protein